MIFGWKFDRLPWGFRGAGVHVGIIVGGRLVWPVKVMDEQLFLEVDHETDKPWCCNQNAHNEYLASHT